MAGIAEEHFSDMAKKCVVGRTTVGQLEKLGEKDILEIYKLAKSKNKLTILQHFISGQHSFVKSRRGKCRRRFSFAFTNLSAAHKTPSFVQNIKSFKIIQKIQAKYKKSKLHLVYTYKQKASRSAVMKNENAKCACQGGTLTRFVQPIILFSLSRRLPTTGMSFCKKFPKPICGTMRRPTPPAFTAF